MRARKGWAAVFAALVMSVVHAANLSVTDVKIAQRYPWNGLVDITYTVNCDDPNKDVWVYPVGYDADKAESVALMPQYLSGQGASNAVHNGTHQMTWDMAKQMGKDYNRAAFSVTLHAYCDAAPYMVIDLSAGSEAEKYPISYLSEIPEGGWTDEYKTTKMVFKLFVPRCCSGFTLTKPYYITVFPMSKQQLYLINAKSYSTGGNQWEIGVSYADLRGSVLGGKWPEFQQVDGKSIIAKLRLRTGITIDLPTEAQWIAAMDYYGTQTDPNGWGIHELFRIGEWCLDWYQKNPPSGNDPAGPIKCTESYETRIVRGRAYPSSTQSHQNPYGSYTVRAQSSGTSFWRDGSYYDRVTPFYPSAQSARYGRNAEYTEGFGCRLVALPVCK